MFEYARNDQLWEEVGATDSAPRNEDDPAPSRANAMLLPAMRKVALGGVCNAQQCCMVEHAYIAKEVNRARIGYPWNPHDTSHVASRVPSSTTQECRTVWSKSLRSSKKIYTHLACSFLAHPPCVQETKRNILCFPKNFDVCSF